MSERAPIREGSVRVDGIGAPVLEAGPEAAEEAVVYLHGNPCSSEDWRDLLGRTGLFLRSVAPDLPGYGRADRSDAFPATLAAYGDWIAGALDELGVRRVHLVLHDFGGGFGFAFAERRPEAVASITLLNAGPLPGYTWHRTARMWRTRGLGEAMMAVTSPKLLSRAIRRDNPGVPVADADRMGRDFDRGSKRTALRLYRSTDPETAVDWSVLRAMDPPVLVVFGAEDPYMGKDHAQRIPATLFPSARVEVLPNAGHWPFFDEPDRVAAHLESFVRAHAGGAPPP